MTPVDVNVREHTRLADNCSSRRAAPGQKRSLGGAGTASCASEMTVNANAMVDIFPALQIASNRRLSIKKDKKMKKLIIASLGVLLLTQTLLSFADNANGKNLYLQRCSMCHGNDLKATGPLANKSNPPTPDLTTSAFKKRLSDYPGVIVSSIILRPNGDLIPRTLREYGVKLSPYSWSIKDLRDLNQYMGGVVSQKR